MVSVEGKNLDVNAKGEITAGCFLVACSGLLSYLSYTTQDHLPGMVTGLH